jgi:hypothetical protein
VSRPVFKSRFVLDFEKCSQKRSKLSPPVFSFRLSISRLNGSTVVTRRFAPSRNSRHNRPICLHRCLLIVLLLFSDTRGPRFAHIISVRGVHLNLNNLNIWFLLDNPGPSVFLFFSISSTTVIYSNSTMLHVFLNHHINTKDGGTWECYPERRGASTSKDIRDCLSSRPLNTRLQVL